MAKVRHPGDFILEVANHGREVTTLLLLLFSSTRARDIATHISLSVTTLTEAGNALNENAEYFKDNFQPKFESILVKFSDKFDIIQAACGKASSWEGGDLPTNAERPQKGPYQKLIWAFGMAEDKFDDFIRSLDEFYKPALFLNYLVDLVVLQIHGQQRELTSAEQTLLYRGKREIGEVLESLRELEIGVVVSFGIAETSHPVNISQITEALGDEGNRNCPSDQASGSTVAVMDLSDYAEKAQALVTDEKKQVPTDSNSTDNEMNQGNGATFFEMYRMAYRTAYNRPEKKVWSSWSFSGIALKREGKEASLAWELDCIPTTQNSIRLFIQKEKANNANYETSNLNSLLDSSANASGILYALINNKNDETKHRAHYWTLECLVPTSEEIPRWFSMKKRVQPNGYIVVLRRESGSFPPTILNCPPVQYRAPPPPHWGGPIILEPRRRSRVEEVGRERKSVKVTLTQEECETVVNDFLASFSTLYDGVSVENRGVVLREIKMESGYYSNDASSTSSRSLVDD